MSSTPGAQPEAPHRAFDGLDTARQRPRRGPVLIRPGGRLGLQHLDLDVGAGGRFLDDAPQSRELLVEVFLGVEPAIDREPRRARHHVEAGAGAGLPADHEHRTRRLLALHRKARALLEQVVGQSGQRRRDPDHVLEGVHALVDVADVRLAAGRPHPQRDGASCRVPDHAAGRLGGQHRDGLGIDQAGVAQVSRAGGAAGLLVAHEVEDDPPPVEQAQRTRRRRPVEHRDEAALHVRGPAPDHLPVAAHGLELRGALGGDDVEVPVVVDDLRPVAHAAAHDRGILQVPGRRELDQLRREVEPVERLAEHGRAAPQLAARRVLGGHAHERLEQRHHLLGAAVEPGLHIGAAIAQAVSVPN